MSEQQPQRDESARLAEEQEQVTAAAMEAGSIGSVGPAVGAGEGESEDQEPLEQELVERIEGSEIESLHDAHVDGERGLPGES